MKPRAVEVAMSRLDADGESPLPCKECGYDLRGLASPGRTAVCPECATANQYGEVDLDRVHLPLPPRWYLAWRVGWPGLAAGLVGLVGWVAVPGAGVAVAAVAGVFALLMTVLMSWSWALDCSAPRARAGAMGYCLVTGAGAWGLAMLVSLGVPLGLKLLLGW